MTISDNQQRRKTRMIGILVPVLGFSAIVGGMLLGAHLTSSRYLASTPTFTALK